MNLQADAEDELVTFFNLSTELLCIGDLNGHFTRVNTAWTRMMKMTAEDCVSRPYLDFVHPDDVESTTAEANKLAHGITTISFQNRYIDTAGGIHWLEWSVRPSMHRGTIYCVARDVTERKETEGRLAEIGRKLEQSNRDLQAFAFVASHDLQEPLRKIQAFGDLLRTECAESLSDDGHLYVESMRSAAARMQNLIADLLTLSRVATREMDTLEVDLGVVIDDVLDDLSVLLDPTVEVRCDALPVVLADPIQMRQLFQNLLANALKFRRTGLTRIRISAGREASFAGRRMCTIEVADNGIGFDPGQAEVIFAPFKRLNGRDKYAGNGIGLAICQRIVERHGATIRATDRGDGATFSVSLPLARLSGKAAL